MEQQIYHASFASLRQAYSEVKRFLEKETSDSVPSLCTTIDNDLGCAGDDNLELLEKFVTRYKLDTDGFDYSKHFLSEAELFGSGVALLIVLGLPVLIVLWLIKIISLGRIDWTKREIFPDSQREVSDLSFGDMLTWYLTGRYNLRKHIQFRLKTIS